MKTRSIVSVIFVGLMLSAGIVAQSTRTYTDARNKLSFSYPSDFIVATGSKARNETAFGDPGEGTKLLAVRPARIPAKYHGGYEFNVWVSKNITKCGAVADDEEIGMVPVGASDSEPTRKISTATFHSYVGAEAGMSKSLDLSGFRSVVDGKCWMIQAVSYQVMAYDDFKPFKGPIIDAAFVQFLDSFRFTNK